MGINQNALSHATGFPLRRISKSSKANWASGPEVAACRCCDGVTMPAPRKTTMTQTPETSMIRHLALTAALAFAFAGHAQYPAKPVKLLVAFPPGGGADLVVRSIGEKLAPRLGQPVVVENKSGAGSNIGADFVAKSAPEGYTLWLAVIQTHTVGAAYNAKLSYDIRRDFTPIARLGQGTLGLVVASGV